MRISSALACVLAVASLAAADPIGSLVMENAGSPAPGLTRYLIYLKVEDGYYAQGFDGRLDGAMYQSWVPIGPGMETPTLDNVDLLAMMGGDPNKDTHIMWHNADLLIPSGLDPHENNSGAPSEGVGSWFGNAESSDKIMAMVVTGANLTNNLLFMQVVIPEGETVRMEGNIGYKWGSEGNWQYGENPVSLLIPEPTTLGLLALTAVGLVARRRRR